MGDIAPGREHVIDMLRADHGHIKELLSRLEKADKIEQGRVLGELFLDLRVHSVLEQQVFYPSLSQIVDAKKKAEFTKDLYGMLTLMLQLESTYASSEPLEETLTVLSERFEQHVKKDEGLFKQVEKWAAEWCAQLNTASDKMDIYRIELKQKLSRNFPRRETTEDRFVLPVIVHRARCA
jgi:hypothetical protein